MRRDSHSIGRALPPFPHRCSIEIARWLKRFTSWANCKNDNDVVATNEIDGPSTAKMAPASSLLKSSHVTAVVVDDKSVCCNEGTGAHRVTVSGPNGFGAIRETLSVL